MGKNPSGPEIVNLPDKLDGAPIELRSLFDHYYELETTDQDQYDVLSEKRPFPNKPSIMQTIKLSAQPIFYRNGFHHKKSSNAED